MRQMMKIRSTNFVHSIYLSATFLIHLNFAKFLLTLWGQTKFHMIRAYHSDFKLSCATTTNCFVLIVLLSPQYNSIFYFQNFLNKILCSRFASSWTDDIPVFSSRLLQSGSIVSLHHHNHHYHYHFIITIIIRVKI